MKKGFKKIDNFQEQSSEALILMKLDKLQTIKKINKLPCCRSAVLLEVSLMFLRRLEELNQNLKK